VIDGAIAGMARDLVRKQSQPTSPEHREETAYRSLCEGLPVLLRTAGLTRTVSFLAAKKKSGGEYAALLEHMQEQLREAGVYSDLKKPVLDLPVWVTSKERGTAEYRQVSTLAFRVAYWHKRLAQALLRKKDEL
jgi:CRISPR type III-B/RAMP module-associated protein Cmr5